MKMIKKSQKKVKSR